MIVYIYNGPGTVTSSVENLKRSLTMALQTHGFDIQYIGAQDVIEGSKLSPERARLFVLGGGRFTAVKKALGHQGIENIQRYTHDGGFYAGICMGSYAAFSDINFQGAERATGQGLSFYNTVAYGSLPIAPPYDGTANSATIVEMQHLTNGEKFPALYWGGNGMDESALLKIGATPLVKLSLDNGLEKIMSARIKVGSNGGKAFICGYHPEGSNRNAIWQWLRGREPAIDCYQRLKHELCLHPDKAYLMGLACMLDDIALTPSHSFVDQVYGRVQAIDIGQTGHSPQIKPSPYPFRSG